MNKIILVLTVLFLQASVAFADGYILEEEQSSTVSSEKTPAAAKQKQTKSSVDLSTKNFGKTERFLPGEEVVTPSGQKLKVWSTKGPVPVSRAPEPFEDREKALLPNSHVVIDAEEIRRRRKNENGRPRAKDSFRVRE